MCHLTACFDRIRGRSYDVLCRGPDQNGRLLRLVCLSRWGTLSVMQLSDQDLKTFQSIWQREFGETLSLDEAQREASLFLELYGCIADTLCKPAPDGDGHDQPPEP